MGFEQWQAIQFRMEIDSEGEVLNIVVQTRRDNRVKIPAAVLIAVENLAYSKIPEPDGSHYRRNGAALVWWLSSSQKFFGLPFSSVAVWCL